MKKEKKLVLVEWNDSKINYDNWRPDDCSEDNVAHCRTVGILKAEDTEKITIASSDSDSGFVSVTITIPKGCITKIKELRVR